MTQKVSRLFPSSKKRLTNTASYYLIILKVAIERRLQGQQDILKRGKEEIGQAIGGTVETSENNLKSREEREPNSKEKKERKYNCRSHTHTHTHTFSNQ